MSNLVTIYGGSGFVGRYIARRMAKAGWRVRVAVRRPNEAIFVKPYGVVGQVEPVLCNIRDDASVAAAMAGATTVINCVGLLNQSGKNTFKAVQAEGAGRIARLAVAAGINKMVHVSSIGADPKAASEYSRTKAIGEANVLAHMPEAVILRPSVVFGPEDTFFNRFASMSRMGPVLPLVGAETLFQPVYVDDIAKAAEIAATGTVAGGVYELGGSEVANLRTLVGIMLAEIRRRRLVLNIPFFAARIMGLSFDLVHKLSLGLVPAPITADQVKSLTHDNVVSEGAKGLSDLGIEPVPMSAILPDYLWRFRPSGQFDAIKESAKNLRV